MDVQSSASRKGGRASSSSNILRIPARTDVEQVLQSFNTWAFKREQPTSPDLLSKFVERAVLKAEPLSFVLYWGKGPRSTVEHYEEQCLDFLASMADRVAATYKPGAAMKLVLTDTHARHNGHPQAEISRYFEAVAAAAARRNFRAYLLGDLCNAAAPHTVIPPGAEPSEETMRQLYRSANRWFRGEGSPEEGARRYFELNMIEREVIEYFFPSSVFVTFNGSEQRPLFPRNLPIFYMYSLKRGTAVKPWFLPDPHSQDVKLAG
jgi:hypothetical protein